MEDLTGPPVVLNRMALNVFSCFELAFKVFPSINILTNQFWSMFSHFFDPLLLINFFLNLSTSICHKNWKPRILHFFTAIKPRLTHYSPVLLFYTPWNHQKTQRFSDDFKGYRKATPDCNGLKAWFCYSKKSINFLEFYFKTVKF